MLIKRKRGWEVSENETTPESVFLNRRNLLVGGGLVAAGGVAGALWLNGGGPGGSGDAVMAANGDTDAMAANGGDPTADLYPAPRNAAYTVEREITAEELNTHYNNFYEFGTSKHISGAAESLKIRPWEVRFDGMVEKEMTIGFDDLIRSVTLEERVYRHRCVEAWSMVVPWTGFPMAKLVEMAKPLSSAKYVRMETFFDPEMARGQKQPWYPWPYVEGVTMAEATNELAFMVTGAYGKPVAKSMGAPLRLHLPWKYGFKSIKSIVRFSFTDERPVNFWQELQSSEYGFWANVNPEVSHPRWSQATEEVIGSAKRVPTQIYNGYGEFVASLYSGMEGEKLFI